MWLFFIKFAQKLFIMDSFKDLVKARRSMRQFTEEKLTEEQVRLLLRAALIAPSSKHTNGWEFVVVDDRDTLLHLSESRAQGAQFIAQAALAVVVLGNPSVSDAWIEDASIAAIMMQLQAEDLLILLGDLRVLRLDGLTVQGVQDGAGVGVLAVDDVAGVLAHVIANLSDRRAVFAAAITNLLLQGVLLHRHVVVHTADGFASLAAAVLQLITKVGDVGIDSVHLTKLVIAKRTDTIVDTVELVADLSKVAGQHIAVLNSASLPVTAAKASAETASTESAKDSQDQDNPNPSTTIAKSKTIITAIGAISANSIPFSKTTFHCFLLPFISFSNIYINTVAHRQ